MKKITPFILQALFLLHVLLAFLVFFESQVEVPFWIQPLGRMHPLILHFPVAFIGLLILLTLAKKSFDPKTYQQIHAQLLLITAFTTIIATLMGFLLSLEGYESDLMKLHKWLGIGLSFYMYLLVYLFNKKGYSFLLFGGGILVVLVGHYGAGLTHGISFITEPLETTEPISENSPIYIGKIQPILDAKCKSCHNSEKPKGGLNVTSIETIKKGGKHGPLWISGQPTQSAFIKRVLLPLNHKEHMAPEGKPQLTEEEIELISLWIHQGVNDTIKLNDLKKQDTLRQLIAAKWTQKKEKVVYSFDVADKQILEDLQSSPYISIHALSGDSPALDATLLRGGTYDPENLKKLEAVKQQLISLNISYLDVKDDEIQILKEFTNLERLLLNFTKVTSKGLSNLTGLPKLSVLSVSGNQLDKNSFDILKSLPSLTTLYLWNTLLDKDEVSALKKMYPHLKIEEGIEKSNAKNPIAPPELVSKFNIITNGSKVLLKHIDPDVTIRYNLDGDVDENSSIYKQGILIDFKNKPSITIKTKAYKKGNLPSVEVRFKIFNKGLDVAFLKTEHPNETADYFGNGEDLLIDNYLPLGSRSAPGWVSYAFKTPFTGVFQLKNNDNQPKQLTFYTGSLYRNSKNNLERVLLLGSNDQQKWNIIDQKKYAKGTVFDLIFDVSLQFKNKKYSYYKLKAIPGKRKKFYISQVFVY